jgi:hypothetical protein
MQNPPPARQEALPISGTFLDEISHDIPHQNWGETEWDRDFQAMSAMGIDTVILIRSGYKRWLAYPSEVLIERELCHRPRLDLLDLFLGLAEKHGMRFYFGTYDSGRDWITGDAQNEVDLNRAVIDEVWRRYGHRAAFQGWYLTHEVSRRVRGIIDVYLAMGRHCRGISEGKLPVLISPYMDGVKAVSAFGHAVSKTDAITSRQHEQEWDEIFAAISPVVDVVAFQDGHVDFPELGEYLAINQKLAARHHLRCWTNSESFDRDMPIKFLPIKWEKLLLKLEAARQAQVEKAITFEFSHFMSPHSAYGQAGHLYNRYREHFAGALSAGNR